LFAQEELSLREEVRAAGARLQLLVQGADIAGAPTASTLDENFALGLTLGLSLSLTLSLNNLSLTLSLTLSLALSLNLYPS